MRTPYKLSFCALAVLLTGCGTKPIQPSDHHMMRESTPQLASKDIPQPITSNVVLPPPKPTSMTATYSVVVTNVPAQQILFELARDAKINLDIHGGIDGLVTVNAINQTLEQILTRIARQVDMRYELNNGSLIVMPDTPYLHSYKIDYVNMDRESQGGVTNTSQISSGSSGGTSGAAGGGNGSQLSIKNSSKNHFWETLTQNIKDILHETDKILPAGSSETTVQQNKASSSTGTGAPLPTNNTKSNVKIGVENSPNPVSVEEGDVTVTKRSTFREAASVIANPEAGIMTVRATGKQHEKIQQFVDQVMSSARRQVMIEATIVEVTLNDNYQQGIDWSKFLAAGTTKGFNVSQKGPLGLTPATQGIGSLLVNYVNPTSKFGNIAASVSLLETFGKTKVLSSPKISVMNNQTAMLRVVDNNVWFNVNSTTAPCSPAPCQPLITYTTTVNTVQVGFTMSVTPQINDSNSVLLNIRPSITRRLIDAVDPTPNLAGGITNKVPQLSTREMESVLNIENNQIAILGGLMEDSADKQTQEVPLLGDIPFLGTLFKSRNDTTKKTELVIFLRPVVIKDASMNGDYSDFRGDLPDREFFHESASGKP
jgi:MSHA biogenesis protein MshL